MKEKFLRYIKEMQKQLDENAHDALDLLKKEISKLPNSKPVAQEGKDLVVPEEVVASGAALALFTDGACRGNPGPGAWGALIQDSDSEVIWEGSGFDGQTTNNKMELKAVIEGLKECENLFKQLNLDHKETLLLYSDSKYVLDGLRSWVPGWKSRGWKKADKKAPENLELWQELDQLSQKFPKLLLRWVKGHSGHPQNDYVDGLANRELDLA
jgi:ribonuclease HI